jgi:lon-related putative ATP-dependent protease
MAHRLEPEHLKAVCDPRSLAFDSTAELPALEGLIGQDRAASATAFGVGMAHSGYNLFVLGPARTGKTSAMRRVLAKKAEEGPPPLDYCYVHNFAEPYRPRALALAAGRGRELRDGMARLARECRDRLPRAFESDEFERRKKRILETLAEKQQPVVDRLATAMRAQGLVVLRRPGGLGLAPAPHGEPLTPDEYNALPEAARQDIAARATQAEPQVDAAVRELRQLERRTRLEHEQLFREIAASAVRQLIEELREQFAGLDAVTGYLGDVEADLVAHAEEFAALGEEKSPLPFVPPPGAFLDRYRVNVLVDHGQAHGAPVVFESNPTYTNLVGRMEHRAHFGSLLTDFTLIRPGALHRANGGYLILEAVDVLKNPLAWDALKKALKSGSVRIEDPLHEWRLAIEAGLQPEPIPLSTKVVLIGSPVVYYLLCALDEDFAELFKVKVDFEDSLPRTAEYELLYARFIATAVRDERLCSFSADGVARVLERCSRLVADQRRLTARLGAILDLVREASYWATERGHALVTADDVSHAIAQKTFRENLLEERAARFVAEGTRLISTDGAVVGQVNGIAVLAIGDYAFGHPSRITARTYVGEPGVIDIEREAKLGGRLHSKGVMILSGFVAGRYAREMLLALSASLAFEQHYEEVDGDSASSAELYALLSSLGGIPLQQGLAVTGSVNQHGEIQAVGGINEKIEGFFDACAGRGLTGHQGVLIPASNVRHLMLRDDVIRAVRDERFHVHAISTVDEGLTLLSGREAGARGPDGRFAPGSFNAAVEDALIANVRRVKEVRASVSGDGVKAH